MGLAVTASHSFLLLTSIFPIFQWVFPMSQLLHHMAKELELKLWHQSFQIIWRVDFLQGWPVWSPCSPKDSHESSPAPNLKASVLWHSVYFMIQLSHLYITTGKTTALTIQTFVSKVISLLFNTLSRFVIDFLPRSKYILISWLKSPSSVNLECKKNLSLLLLFSPSICHEVMDQIPWS